jgi:GntR family transcriptional regulator of vanillate catabolism
LQAAAQSKRSEKPGQRVIIALRKMIASGELQAGQRIAEIKTAETLSVSRMPVRMALLRLEREGLVARLGARGYAVRGVSPAQIIGAIDVRGALEGLAARQAAERSLDRAAERVLRHCLEVGDALFSKGRLVEGDLDRYHAFNRQFHSAIVKASGNPAIEIALAHVEGLPFASASALALDAADLEEEYRHLSKAHRQHHTVFEAILERAGERAETLMRDHARAAIRNVKVFEGLFNSVSAMRLIGGD